MTTFATGSGQPPGDPGEPATAHVHLGAAAALARRIAVLEDQDPVVTERAGRLAERIAAQRFHIAVLGEFKRGKSTLINALVGQAVLPTGAVPLTTVATEVHFGSTSGAAVVFDDGRRVPIAEGEIASFVTEAANPDNRRGVQRVEVGVATGWAAPGLVLVDTPGIASVHEHQTTAARAALAEADGAVVVLSADSPLSESEEALLADLADRRYRIFVVVNKCDHLTAAELAEVRTFIGAHVRRLLGDGAMPHYLAARPALENAVAASAPGEGNAPVTGFLAFQGALASFVRNDLAGARADAALAELHRLGSTVETASSIEVAASALGLERIERQARLFQEAVSGGRQLFGNDRLVLHHEVELLASELGRILANGASGAATTAWQDVAAALANVPLRRLDRELDAAVVTAVEGVLEPLRQAAQSRAEDGWAHLAVQFGSRMRTRVEDLRTRAGELFEVHLPAAPVTGVGEERERFSYLFLLIESPGVAAGRLFLRLLPLGAVRRRTLRRAQDRLLRELDKHAARARYDLVERLNAAERRFVTEMAGELEETERTILTGIDRARALIAEGDAQRPARDRARAEVAALVHDVTALSTAATGTAPG